MSNSEAHLLQTLDKLVKSDDSEHVCLYVDVDTEDSSYLGFELKLGHSKALRSLRMCVCVYLCKVLKWFF